MQQIVILLVINSPSTCFERLYAHRQEVRRPDRQPTPHSAHSLPADSPTSQQLQQLQQSQQSQQDRKPQAVKMQSDLLTMGVKTPETC